MNCYLGEVRLFGFGIVPKGWVPCDGQTLAISKYAALFSLIGATYGGDGRQTFAIPDLRGRIATGAAMAGGVAPLRQAHAYPVGSMGGEERVSLTGEQVPTHTHQAIGTSAAATDDVQRAGRTWAECSATGLNIYAGSIPASAEALLSSGTLGQSGGSAAHDNMQPYLALQYCMALIGAYPSFSQP